jgi:hypothetical protein
MQRWLLSLCICMASVNVTIAPADINLVEELR